MTVTGVATFVRDGATPWKAEDGLTGISHEEDEELCIGHYGDHSSFTYEELEALDREGRCVMTQHIIKFVHTFTVLSFELQNFLYILCFTDFWQ